MSVPVYYDHINAVVSQSSPSTVHTRNNALSHFFARYLLQKAMSVFKWTLPDNWPQDFFLYGLYCYGYMAVVNTDKYGVIPQYCGLQGYDVFYRPTNAVITNPLLTGILTPRIGTDCVVVRLQPDYGSILDMVTYYADMMALCSEAAGMNFVNSKLAYVFTANKKAAAESLKKLFDQIAAGNPAVVQDKQLLMDDGQPAWATFAQDLRSNYIASDLLSDMRKIEAMFDTDIGIPNANTDKRERLITDEVNANNTETASKCSVWLEQLKKSCADCRDMFGINISVDWRFNPITGGADNARDSISIGAV